MFPAERFATFLVRVMQRVYGLYKMLAFYNQGVMTQKNSITQRLLQINEWMSMFEMRYHLIEKFI